VHLGMWERLTDALFWLQVGWIVSGFLLMGYLAVKVFPRDSDGQSPSAPALPKRELITLGNYRFEVPSDVSTSRCNIIELPQRKSERQRSLMS